MNDEMDAVRSRRSGARSHISGHPAFVPIVTIWAAAMLGLSILVIPMAMAEQLGAIFGLTQFAPLALAAIAGLIGALTGFGGARLFRSYQSEPLVRTPALPFEQAVAEPVDPQQSPSAVEEDKGIDEEVSQDDVLSADVLILADAIAEEAPADAEPTDPAMRARDQSEHMEQQTDDQSQALVEAEPAVVEASTPAKITPFLPWPDGLEQPVAEVIAVPAPKAAPSPDNKQIERNDSMAELAPKPAIESAAPGKAVQQLRSEAIDKMNMVQLLERFAVALGDYRQHADAPHSLSVDYSMANPNIAGPSEALDALTDPIDGRSDDHLRTGVSIRTRAIETENALRDALAKLDRLNGAA